MTKSQTSAEILNYWADMGDNRFGPVLQELVEAILDTEDPATLTKLANRLKFMSSSVISHRDRVNGPPIGGAPSGVPHYNEGKGKND